MSVKVQMRPLLLTVLLLLALVTTGVLIMIRRFSCLWKRMLPMHLLPIHNKHTFNIIGIHSIKHELQDILHRYRNAQVNLIEPNPGEYKSLFANNNIKANVIPKAVVAEAVHPYTQFFIHNNRGSVNPPPRHFKSTKRLNVEVITLDQLLRMTNGCTVLYINVHGLEFNVLQTWLSRKIKTRYKPHHIIIDRSEMYGSYTDMAKFNTLQALFEYQKYYIEYDLTQSWASRIVFPNAKHVMFTHDRNRVRI